MNYAPVVLFVYNRPAHTQQTLEALVNNILADESTLYIYADGPKEGAALEELERIKSTREVIRRQKGFKEIIIVESENNKGLANSIIGGVTNVVTKFGKVIVLEDDILTSQYFLMYMNKALELYKEDESVMHISGYFPPVKTRVNSKTFFFNQTSCWGWGTWANSWKHFVNDASFLSQEIEKLNRVEEFNMDNSYPFMMHLKANERGEMNTWAIKWHASVFLKDGLCLHPKKSLVRNIGFDGSGENCWADQVMQQQKLAKSITIRRIELKESYKARIAVVKYNKPKNRKSSFYVKFYIKLKSLISKWKF